ncbi:MAG: poly-gamma-glutamate biosynthesis protein PgsC [Bacteroidetes bacterium]|nr:poly-gamma-glutamate biosynthesis protein PgsC [Bacteroidota bacterium]
MIIETLFIGLVVAFLYYEIVGLSPGGVVAPGYLALYIQQPQKIAVTILIAVLVWWVITISAKYFILYGRRKLLFALLLGFCVKYIFEQWVQPSGAIPLDLHSIGYIIPGLIANEFSRQKFIPTFTSLGIVTALVYFILLIVTP